MAMDKAEIKRKSILGAVLLLTLIAVVMVDDEDFDTYLVERSYQKSNLDNPFLAFNDGPPFLQFMEDVKNGKEQAPLLVLLDINMPRMNGHEFLAALRDSEKLKHARVFVFTTSDSKKDIDLAYKNNVSGYIVKPNSSSVLRNILLSLQNFWDICENPSEAL